MTFDPVFLSRLQFAWVIGWHILLPALTVGAASFIALAEGLSLATAKEVYVRVSIFWTKIFSIAFGMGVVTGIILPFQLGTNWSRYVDSVANVLSPPFAYEGLTTFFLESAFLGVLLFGRKLVPPWAHFVAALMVALGTLFSSFWILSANSWMQTPAGYEIVNGQFLPRDWLEVIFSPSFPYRLAHTVVAFFVTPGFAILGVGAYLVRRERSSEEGRTMFSMALWLLTVLVPLQMVIGDLHGLNTRKYQPAKLAAIEARWDTGRGVPLTIFAVPDDAAANNKFEIEIPRLGSLVLTHDINGEVLGLKDFPADQRPPVAIPFFAFRLMVGCGFLMLAFVGWGGWLRWRNKLFDTPFFLSLSQAASVLGFVAVIAGWCVTEVGRQPWTVCGLLRTAISVSPSLKSSDVALSLSGYMLVYLLIFPWGLYLVLRIIRRGPAEAVLEDTKIEGGQSSGPVLAGAVGVVRGARP
jgi:cytochrome bd-type quinol oxidase subunit 1